MKFTLFRLKHPLEPLAAVEEGGNPGATRAPFATAKAPAAEEHPDADKLRLCRGLTIDGEKTIVLPPKVPAAGGIDLMAMLKFGIPDLRAFFESDLRWLKHYGFAALDLPTVLGGVSK